MRGSSLSNPEVVDLLQPFLVTSWHGAGESGMPDDVKEVFRASEVPKTTNVYIFMLDADGKLVHGFHALPGRRNPTYLHDEIKKGLERIKLPEKIGERRGAGVPDLKTRGVRIFLRADGPWVVELVPMDDWKALEWSKAARDVPAEALRSWLVQLYPPAIRTAEQSRPFRKIEGTLRWRPAGDKTAHLEGDVRLFKDDAEPAFEGKLRAVLTYNGGGGVKEVKGVVEGGYRGVRIEAAIESRP